MVITRKIKYIPHLLAENTDNQKNNLQEDEERFVFDSH